MDDGDCHQCEESRWVRSDTTDVDRFGRLPLGGGIIRRQAVPDVEVHRRRPLRVAGGEEFDQPVMPLHRRAPVTAESQQLRPPHRLLVILEGESLFNDASALLIYRIAVGATLTGILSGWSVIPTLLIVTAGSVVLGLVLARVIGAVTAGVEGVAYGMVCGAFAGLIAAYVLYHRGLGQLTPAAETSR